MLPQLRMLPQTPPLQQSLSLPQDSVVTNRTIYSDHQHLPLVAELRQSSPYRSKLACALNANNHV